MRGLISLMLALLMLLIPPARATGNSFAIRDVRLFDGTRVTEHANVVVRDGIVMRAGRGATIPKGLTVIDGDGRTLLPGLIDSHVHVFPGAQADALRFGVTTELDMFSLRPDFARWRAQRQSLAQVTEADTWSAGLGVSAPGGHPSGTMPGSADIPTLAGPRHAAAFVTARIEEGSDYVKIILEDNSVLTPDRLVPALSTGTVCAAVRAAHRRGKLAIVHASRLRDARTAIECRADGLAHLFADALADPGFIALARARKVFIQSTLGVVAAGSEMALVPQFYAEPEVAALLSTAQKKMLAAGFYGPVRPRGIGSALQSVRLLHAAGIPLMAGSDAPNPGAPHGAGLHLELRLLVLAGLPPIDALRAATSIPAARFDLPGRGRIAAGSRADLLLVRGDPTTNIAATTAIERVWKNGFPVASAP